jgi:mannosyltransferase PIG-V
VRSRKLIAIADALTIVCVVAAVALALFGAFRGVAGGAVISIRWMHAAFGALGLAIVRHVLVPSPSLAETLRGVTGAFARRPALADATLAFWTTRPIVLLVGLIAVSAIGVPPTSVEGVGRDPLNTLPARFDSGWYASIAEDGYDWQYRFDRQQNLAFFPAYPLLMRGAGALMGAADSTLPRERRIVRYSWAGLFLSLGAFFWASWYFARIAHELLDDDAARGALMLLAAYPFAIFYSAAYTEALYLLAAVGAWHHFRRSQWTRAALWGLLAGLARPNGFFLSVPFALLAVGLRDAGAARPGAWRWRGPMALAAAAMPAIGMLAFTVYVYDLTGVWFGWARMHGAWGRSFDVGDVSLAPIGSAAGLVQYAAAHPYQVLNALGLSFALALAWPVWRTLGPAWATFVVASIVPPLLAGGVLSMGRLTSTLFPLFLALAASIPRRAAVGWVAAFGILQGLAAVLFFTWRELF